MTIKKTSNIQNIENNKQDTRVRSANKRPRAPIACFRCHHKKVRCDGARPNCTRCLSTGVLCAYPSSRRSRTTQPANVDPFIDNLSQLEARIRRIEIDLEKQRSMVHSIFSNPVTENPTSKASDLANTMKKTENEVQESKSIIAQLRLRGEQRISRTKRAAAAQAASSSEQKTSQETKENTKAKKANNNNSALPSSTSADGKHMKHPYHEDITNNMNIKPELTPTSATTDRPSYNPSFYYQNMMLDNNSDISSYDTMVPGHGMDWTLFDPESISHHEFHPNDANNMAPMISPNAFMQNVGPTGTSLSAPPLMSRRNMMMEKEQPDMMMTDHTNSMISPPPTRSSSLVSNPPTFMNKLQPSSSTTSTNTNATALSSATSCSSVNINMCDTMFNFPIDTMLLQGGAESQDHHQHHIESNNPWYYS